MLRQAIAKYPENIGLLRCYAVSTVVSLLWMRWYTKTVLILASIICCASLSLLIGSQLLDSVFKTFLGEIAGLTTNGILCVVMGVSLGTIVGIKLIK